MTSPVKTLTQNQLLEYLIDRFFQKWTDSKKLTGLELEVIPFKRSQSGVPYLVPLYTSGRAHDFWREKDPDVPWPGLVSFLKSHQGVCAGLRYEPLDEQTPRFLLDSGAQITFEPGGQLEYSSTAMESIEKVTKNLFNTLECLEKLLAPYDISFFFGALNPWFRVEEVGLNIKKERYVIMDRYFSRLSPFGQKMMRLSASFQVNLDIGDRETAQRRWLASNLLSPVFLAMFGNSPFHQKKATGAKSFRAVIWENLDPTRTGFQDDFVAKTYDSCPSRQYMNFALNAYCMLPVELGNQSPPMRFGEWMESGYDGTYPDLNDWITHLSTLFPEVRPRGFLEMRYMDTLPKAFFSVPGTLLRRILYEDHLLETVIEELAPCRTRLRQVLTSAAFHGLENNLLLEKAQLIFKKVLNLPPDHDGNLLAIAETFYKNYTGKGISPADELLTLRDGKCPRFDQFSDLSKKRMDLVSDPFSRLLNQN